MVADIFTKPPHHEKSSYGPGDKHLMNLSLLTDF